ncbi:MAG: hypothetical protein ACYS8L_09420 [Planctomycetota bacterium]|jgi:hypothetical protein
MGKIAKAFKRLFRRGPPQPGSLIGLRPRENIEPVVGDQERRARLLRGQLAYREGEQAWRVVNSWVVQCAEIYALYQQAAVAADHWRQLAFALERALGAADDPQG